MKYQARRLTEEDLSAYLRAGTRANKSKVSALKAGQQIILTSARQIKQFINNAIDKKLSSHTTVAYGKVNDRLADDVLVASNGSIKIKDNYLELIPDNLQHAYEQHHTAKQVGDIDLERSDFENIPEYLDSYTEVVYAIEYASGKVGVCVSKRLPNGRILLIETVSKSRGALQFKNAIGVSESKYQSDYASVYKNRARTNTRGAIAPITPCMTVPTLKTVYAIPSRKSTKNSPGVTGIIWMPPGTSPGQKKTPSQRTVVRSILCVTLKLSVCSSTTEMRWQNK